MAEIIVKSAFVDKVLVGKDGAFGVRTSEPHSRKNDQGGYDTTGRTFRTLRGRGIDWSQFQERDRIAFHGREVTEEREHDGKKYYDLNVWVDGVMRVESTGGQRVAAPADTWAAAQPVQAAADAWGAPSNAEDVPF